MTKQLVIDNPSNTLIVLLTGSQMWTDAQAIMHRLGVRIMECRDDPKGPRRFILLHGNCPKGGDAVGREIWVEHWGFEEHAMDADWTYYHKAAGQIRNADMVKVAAFWLAAGCRVVCEAFIYEGSPGASRTSELAERAHIVTHKTVCNSRVRTPVQYPQRPLDIPIPGECEFCGLVTTLDPGTGVCVHGCYSSESLAEAQNRSA